MKKTTLTGLGLAVLVLLSAACKEDPDPKEYDRTALTANIGENIIVPGYDALHASVTDLKDAAAAFRQAPDSARLHQLETALTLAWVDWKYCSAFEFGPAASVSLRAVLNTFPCDSNQILANVNAGTWDLNAAANIDARGFPALDYMVSGVGQNFGVVLRRYQSATDSAKLQNYLAALTSDMEAQVFGVATAWDSYLATFKASQGTDVGSSTSAIVNELNRDLEIIKTASIGIPLGKQTFGAALPGKVEGLYGELSKGLIVAELTGLQIIFEGQAGAAANRYGLREAVDAVEAQYNGQSLGEAISAQFPVAIAAVNAIPEPLSDAVVNQAPTVENAYNEIQKLVVMLKSDMASALSILITYTDADGD